MHSNGTALVLARDGNGRTERLELPLADVSRVEVSRGRNGRGRGAKIGALAGAAAALVVGAAAGGNCSGDEMLCFGHGTTAGMAAILTVPVGALIGLAVPPGERWSPAPGKGLSVQPIASRGGGVGVRLALAF